MKEITYTIKDNGLEETVRLNPESEDFNDTFGNFLCELFDATEVNYRIELDNKKED